MKPQAPDIYRFTDYRAYLKDLFKYMKSIKPFFSYQYLAQKAGFKAKSFIYKVMIGERSLSQNSVFRLAQALNLNRKEIGFFESLVHFNESKTASEREYYFLRLQQAGPKNEGSVLQQNQFAYFSNWYNAVIRELITVIPFDNDYKTLARMVKPAITPAQAKESVRLLLDLGLVRKNEKRLYEQTNVYITTRDTILPVAVHKFQHETLKIALDAHESNDTINQDFSTLTVGISSQGYEKICRELKDFRAYIGRIVAEDNPIDRVYQINFQIFPVSSILNTKKG
jgi:uncharacterized protein (TIGR02147 family)